VNTNFGDLLVLVLADENSLSDGFNRLQAGVT
jgi:hypothetical protein